MPTLTYASPKPDAVPSALTRSLAHGWRVAAMPLHDVAVMHTLPDILCLDLGRKVTPATTPWEVFQNLGFLQSSASHPAMIVITGAAPTDQDHRHIVHQAFTYFPTPDQVDIDMKGPPDFPATLAKFAAMRRRRTLQPARPGAAGPAADLPDADLRDENGNLSARRIARLFGLTLTELGRWLGRKKAALSKSPSAASLQPLLQPYARIALLRRALDGSDVAFRKWLRTPHTLLEDRSPLHWMETGQAQVIAEFVHDALTGQPT